MFCLRRFVTICVRTLPPRSMNPTTTDLMENTCEARFYGNSAGRAPEFEPELDGSGPTAATHRARRSYAPGAQAAVGCGRTHYPPQGGRRRAVPSRFVLESLGSAAAPLEQQPGVRQSGQGRGPNRAA